MITKLLLMQNKRANDTQGEKEKGKQFGSQSGVFWGLQPQERLISQALVRVVKCHDFSVSCIVSVRSMKNGMLGQQASWQTRLNQNQLPLKDEQRGSEQPASCALHNCREGNIVWHPRVHPLICDCK